MREEGESRTGLIIRWLSFLKRQESSFKVNILKNLAQRFLIHLTNQYQPIYVTELGANPLILGYISSLGGLVNTLLSIPSGLIADRFGIKKVLLINISIFLLSVVLFGLAMSWEIAAVALILSAVGLTLGRTVCPMICGSTLDSSERVTGMGLCVILYLFSLT